MEGALDALHAYAADRGDVVTCEAQEPGARWRALVVVHGGRPQVCGSCAGTGDGGKPERCCRQCGGVGVV